MFRQIRADALASAGFGPLLDQDDAAALVAREMLALEAKLRESIPAQRDGEAHPDPALPGARPIEDLGHAHIETPVDPVDAPAQTVHDRGTPSIVGRERCARSHHVTGVLPEEGQDAIPRLRPERLLERQRITHEPLEIARRHPRSLPFTATRPSPRIAISQIP